MTESEGNPLSSHRGLSSPAAEVPHALPTPLTTFVGRQSALVEVAALLAERRLVSLVGAPGVGKTRLATEAASRASAHYPDGLWLVDLAQMAEPRHLARAVAAVLSVREQPDEPVAQAIARTLALKSVLLVLDNCEHLARSCADFVCELLSASPNLTVLATSREALGAAGEAVWLVPPLAVPGPEDSAMCIVESDATRLFVARVPTRLAITDDIAPVVGLICRRLDGIPLAIELAARRLGELTLHEIEAKLDDRFQLLRSDLAGLPSRHFALHTALEWSHSLLPDPDAILLRRLTVFAGSFDEDAVSQVCGGSQLISEDVGRLLRELARRSLVVTEPLGHRMRYRLHETIRYYGKEKLAATGEEVEYLENHARWCLGLAEQADAEQPGPHSARCMERLAIHAADLRAALVWSLDHDADLALALAGSASRFWLAHGHLHEAKEWLGRALETATVRDDLRARALWGVAFMACLTGDSVAVPSVSEEALHLAREAGDVRTSARILNLLGVFRVLTDPAGAPSVLIEAASLARKADEKMTLTSSLGMLGFAHYLCGDLVLASKPLEESVTVGRSMGDSQALAIGLVGWGAVKHQVGDLEHARTLVEDGVAMARRVNDPTWLAVGLGFLAELICAQGDYQCARHLVNDAVRTARQVGSPPVIALCSAIRAKLELEAGVPRAGVQHLEEALSICRTSRFICLHSQVLVGLGRVQLAAGKFDEAQLFLEEAVVVAEKAKNRLTAAEALHWLAHLFAARDDRKAALGLQMEALVLQARASQLTAIPSSLDALAWLIADEGDRLRAARLLGAAEALRLKVAVVRSANAQAEHAATVALLEEPDFKANQAARAAGSHLTLDEAITYARGSRGTRRRPKWGWTSLTPTERRVVELVGDGLTNRQVGERLLMSPRTVQTHLAKVYRKLDLRSRTELAREVVRHSQ